MGPKPKPRSKSVGRPKGKPGRKGPARAAGKGGKRGILDTLGKILNTASVGVNSAGKAWNNDPRDVHAAAPVAVSTTRTSGTASFSPAPGGNGITVTHREFVTTISPNVDNPNNFFVAAAFPLNPGLSTVFNWLSSIATGWESYQWRELNLEFLTSSATAQTGSLVIACDYDAQDSIPPGDAQQMETFEGCARMQPWVNNTFKCSAQGLHKQKSYTVRSQDVTTGGDDRLYDAGVMYVATQGCTSNAALGDVWFAYSCVLKTSQQSPAIAELINPVAFAAHADIGAPGLAFTAPFSGAPVVQAGGDPGVGLVWNKDNGFNYLQFKRNGIWLVLFQGYVSVAQPAKQTSVQAYPYQLSTSQGSYSAVDIRYLTASNYAPQPPSSGGMFMTVSVITVGGLETNGTDMCQVQVSATTAGAPTGCVLDSTTISCFPIPSTFTPLVYMKGPIAGRHTAVIRLGRDTFDYQPGHTKMLAARRDRLAHELCVYHSDEWGNIAPDLRDRITSDPVAFQADLEKSQIRERLRAVAPDRRTQPPPSSLDYASQGRSVGWIEPPAKGTR
jgi:hypothetical protein